MKEWVTQISEVSENKVLIYGYQLEEIIEKLSFAEGIYLILRGRLPDGRELTMMNALLNSTLNHGFVSASVIAARYVASGSANFIAAVAAGLLTVGQNTINPAHSANFIRKAHDKRTAEGLGIEAAAAAIVEECKRSQTQIPGFGHPTHKGHDFRAVKLRQIATANGCWNDKCDLYEAIHREFQRATGKDQIAINVDGMAACVMDAMGFSPDEMAAVASLSVLPGIMAHVIEELRQGRRLRHVDVADSEYVGPAQRPIPDER